MSSFYDEECVSTSPNPQPGGPPIVGCPRLFIQYTRSYPSGGLLLLPQREDAKCCGDRNPLIRAVCWCSLIFRFSIFFFSYSVIVSRTSCSSLFVTRPGNLSADYLIAQYVMKDNRSSICRTQIQDLNFTVSICVCRPMVSTPCRGGGACELQ